MPDWLIWLIAIPILGILLILGGILFLLAAMFVSRLLDLFVNFALYGTPDSPYRKKSTASTQGMPAPKEETACVRIDPDLLGFFSGQEKSCESMINEVLRKYVDAHRQ